MENGIRLYPLFSCFALYQLLYGLVMKQGDEMGWLKGAFMMDDKCTDTHMMDALIHA
jgi:hypothetical protein